MNNTTQTAQEIIEGNAAIEKFVGKEFHEKLCYQEFGAIDYSECRGFYHTSWDWLMPVVEKIENMGHPFHIVRGDVVVHFNNTISSPSIAKHFGRDKKESIWQAVVQFIQWYTLNKS